LEPHNIKVIFKTQGEFSGIALSGEKKETSFLLLKKLCILLWRYLSTYPLF